MNARAYGVFSSCTYTLTDPTENQGKLVTIVFNNPLHFDDLEAEVMATGIPGVWMSKIKDANKVLDVDSGDLCVVIGNVEQSYSEEAWKRSNMKPRTFPSVLVLHCALGQLFAFRTKDVTLEEVKEESGCV